MKHMLIQGLAALCLCLASVAATANIIVSFDPSASGPLMTGDTISVDIVGTFDDPNEILSGGAIDLAFDPTVVHVLGVDVDDSLFAFHTSDGTIDNTAGMVTDILFGAGFFDTPSDSFKIAEVSFQAVGVGTSLLTMTDPKDLQFAWALFAPTPGTIDPTFHGGSIEVQAAAMPEPPMMILMVATFGLLGLQRWRHKGEPSA
ncbi:MAG: hypothetical protein GY701_02165 [Sulfitobacter sp.]|nr:hypothetical protein [Sulfitobacter sp.]